MRGKKQLPNALISHRKDIFISAYKYTVEKSSREKWIYVEGVVVSICLASIFFVALVVFICYYRAQKKTSPQRCEVPKSSSKGNKFRSFVVKVTD